MDHHSCLTVESAGPGVTGCKAICPTVRAAGAQDCTWRLPMPWARAVLSLGRAAPYQGRWPAKVSIQ